MFKRWWWIFLIMAVITPALGLMTAAVITYVMPKKFESTALIEIKPARTGRGSAEPPTPNFFATEFAKIKSRNALFKVVDRLDLTNLWSMDRETAVKMLSDLVQVENQKGTDLILIRARHTDKEQAKNIAAEVAHAYRDYRSEIESEDSAQALQQMKNALTEQEAVVAAKRKKLEELVAQHGVETSPDQAETRQTFQTEQDVLNELRAKAMQDEIIAKMPDSSVVIHDEPTIPQVPASPNVPVNLGLGLIFGLLLSPVLALPLMMLLQRLFPATAPTVDA